MSPSSPPPPLASASEVGRLEVLQLKRLWSRALASRAGQPTGSGARASTRWWRASPILPKSPPGSTRSFQGPELHWDVSLTPPIPMGTQGVIYLTDTLAEQGAFTCVPGFHHRIERWLQSLAPDADPRQQDLHALGSRAIAGRAGDLIIWHQALPHGSRPNRATLPRLVQYINMLPTQIEQRDAWR